jgi:hypothetical protein
MLELTAPVQATFDPHVGNAIFALVMALVAAVAAFALGLADRRR